nr:hypothetical protein [Streptomyces broussonetiae]
MGDEVCSLEKAACAGRGEVDRVDDLREPVAPCPVAAVALVEAEVRLVLGRPVDLVGDDQRPLPVGPRPIVDAAQQIFQNSLVGRHSQFRPRRVPLQVQTPDDDLHVMRTDRLERVTVDTGPGAHHVTFLGVEFRFNV